MQGVDPLVWGLIRARVDRGMTRTDVARATGQHLNSMWRWETGKSSPHLDTLHAWAAALGKEVRLEVPAAEAGQLVLRRQDAPAAAKALITPDEKRYVPHPRGGWRLEAASPASVPWSLATLLDRFGTLRVEM